MVIIFAFCLAFCNNPSNHQTDMINPSANPSTNPTTSQTKEPDNSIHSSAGTNSQEVAFTDSIYRFADYSDPRRHQILLQFITNKLSGNYGIYTNYLDTKQNELVATGHEVLSESYGLVLRYYARTGNQKLFAESASKLSKTFDTTSGFSYRYSPKQEKKYRVNAAVDDLRIIRAFYEASEQFHNEAYKHTANKLAQRFLKYNVQDNQMFDFYDDEYQVRNDFITLCYIDLRTLELITLLGEQAGAEQLDLQQEGEEDQQTQGNQAGQGNKGSSNDQESYDRLLPAMLQISKNGYISDQFPFYETRYSFSEKQYYSEDINTIESLLTILSLAEVNQHEQSSIQYLKKQVEQGTLYGKYSRDGKPLTDVQSTAIYALTAMIASEISDEQLYKDSMYRLEQLQVMNPYSELYGGYGNAATLQAYSFDNLQALLAYTY